MSAGDMRVGLLGFADPRRVRADVAKHQMLLGCDPLALCRFIKYEASNGSWGKSKTPYSSGRI
jgi:hypothetical protein